MHNFKTIVSRGILVSAFLLAPVRLYSQKNVWVTLHTVVNGDSINPFNNGLLEINAQIVREDHISTTQDSLLFESFTSVQVTYHYKDVTVEFCTYVIPWLKSLDVMISYDPPCWTIPWSGDVRAEVLEDYHVPAGSSWRLAPMISQATVRQ